MPTLVLFPPHTVLVCSPHVRDLCEMLLNKPVRKSYRVYECIKGSSLENLICMCVHV